MKTNYVSSRIVIFLLAIVMVTLPISICSAAPKYPDTHIQPSISSPCVVITLFQLAGIEKLPNITPKQVKVWQRMIEGQCIGHAELLAYADYISAEFARAGYLTSYLSYPEQSLSLGILQAEVITGTISNVLAQGGSHLFPFKTGDVLNLRHIEQGLYNLQNSVLIPYRIELVHGSHNQHGTDVIVIGKNQREWSGSLSTEYRSIKGSSSTTANHVLTLANPLRISDLLNIHYSLGYSQGNKRQSLAVSYSAPYRYWLFSLYGDYQNSQSCIDLDDIELDLQQHQKALLLNTQYILSRTENSLSSLIFGSKIQTIDTFLAGQRLMTQRRLASYSTGEFIYQRDFRQGHGAISLKYMQGNNWFGANAAQITKLKPAQIYQLSFTSGWRNPSVYYQNGLDIQLSRAEVDSMLERGSFIGQHGVQGFLSTERVEMGDNSLKLHNEFSWDIPWKRVQLYSSIGLGTTSNDRATFWRKNMLVGCKFGVRGAVGAVAYHVFFEAPLWQVNQVVANTLHSGFQLSINY